MLELGQSALIHDVAGVKRGGGLEEHHPAFFFGNWAMLHAAGDDNELAFLDPLVAFAESFVAKLHAEAAFDHEKHFVLVVMMMPDEWRIELHEFDHLAVEFGGDVRLVALRNLAEFFSDVD